MHYFVRQDETMRVQCPAFTMSIVKAYNDGAMVVCTAGRVTKAEWKALGWMHLQLTKQQAACPFCR